MKLPILSGKKLIKFLIKNGFYIEGQKGSHIKMKKKNGKTLVTIIPLHKKIDPGTLLDILRQTKLEKEDLNNLK
ncbi:MAG: type II toxin-antitoxin system HicA family toxin [Candidatus Diapherotrites archaeon]|nr:type II toxin-antitoxin system HicA family toxin [Candidatus Diapherotrites archaeon]MBT4596781.1 type II toxin-antitoxin system HicA family toxin [Candidatus Diapherotrites archaeon]